MEENIKIRAILAEDVDFLSAFGKRTEGRRTGPRLNIKTVLSTYGDFHVKDKTAFRTSYL